MGIFFYLVRGFFISYIVVYIFMMYDFSMKKIFTILFLLILTPSIVFAGESSGAKKIFKYHIPDVEVEKPVKNPVQKVTVSDDITADTSIKESEADFVSESSDKDYEIVDMYSEVLKGYAIYDEEDEDSIFLETSKDNALKLNIKQPQKITLAPGVNYVSELEGNFFNPSKYSAPEFLITPQSSKTQKSIRGFSAGTTYSHEISFGELEQTSGIFSKVQYKRFSVSTSFSKTINSTNNTYNDKIGFTPELRLNQYLTLKENFSTDLIKKKNKAELVLSINPLGKRDIDRIRFDIGASRTYNLNDETFKSQIQFQTRFRL